MSRYKNTDWLSLYKRRRLALYQMALIAATRGDTPAALLRQNARMILEAHYAGPWKMLWALFKEELKLAFQWYWLRFKTRLGFKDEDLAMADRFRDEEFEIQELARQL